MEAGLQDGELVEQLELYFPSQDQFDGKCRCPASLPACYSCKRTLVSFLTSVRLPDA